MEMNNKNTHSERAVHFKKARLQHFYEIAEDYTEMIADLIAAYGKVRICDLAKEMGVSHVNVIKTIKKLIRDGYLIDNIHPLINLTSKGKATANYSKKKHLILLNFLLEVGVPEDVAAGDVEGIEHHISPATLNALEVHLESLREGL